MIKSFFVFTFLLFSSTSFASSEYAGTWCQKFDDFTSVVVIDNENKITVWSIGNEAGENTQKSFGYVSPGGSRFNIFINNQDTNVIDYKIGKRLFSNLKTLTFFMNDGSREKYTECKLIQK